MVLFGVVWCVAVWCVLVWCCDGLHLMCVIDLH